MQKRRKTVYDIAREYLIFMVILSAVNVAMTLTGSNTSFLFSNYISYSMALTGRIYCDVLQEGPEKLLLFGSLAVMMLIAYLLCWILSKKRRAWLVAALVLFAADTLWLILDTITFINGGILLNLVFHALVLVYLFLGVKNGSPEKSRAGEEAEDTEDAFDADADTDAAAEPEE